MEKKSLLKLEKREVQGREALKKFWKLLQIIKFLKCSDSPELHRSEFHMFQKYTDEVNVDILPRISMENLKRMQTPF